MHVPWRSNFFSEFSQLDIKESCSRNRFNTIPFNSRNNELEGAWKRVDLTIVEEEKEKEWITPINRAINDSFFFFSRRGRRESSYGLYGSFRDEVAGSLNA